MQSIRALNKQFVAKNVKSFSAAAERPSLGGFWMPFTDHDRFKKQPKMFSRADGVFFYTEDGREIYDSASGLWCVNAGHNNKKIVAAVQEQAGKLDYAPCFNAGHRLPITMAQKLLELVPNRNFQEVFFTMCGSTAVDTSLKIALAYQRARGQGQRVKFLGRERGYHGVNFGGISVGGIMANRKNYSGNLLPNIDHLPHTHSLKDMAFSRGLPKWGAHLADDLEKLIQFHDPTTIAAVMIEPVAGSTGVLVPPEGYLQKVQEICKKYDILLIFDEVITGFGRVGGSFATEKFNVTPDMITCAKGLTNAMVPAGAVICNGKLMDAIHSAAHQNPETQIELFHGYTYTGHPLAMAAGLATLEVYKEMKLFERTDELAPYFEEQLHSLKGLPNIIDIRNYGLMGAVEFAPIPGAPVKRAMDIFDRCFEHGMFVRAAGNALAFSPPLISEKKHIDRLVDTLARSVKESAASF